ncbi:gastrula zinc finger protein XlCGF8.2DB-like [Topomyia yanbarensis]|uniref:gastrula zinc finger protein XlCGF8.2DB-like n=1 Tax=Topomyia yanbarensis TaxID=2498891 RepID=UPI00273C74BF|nr:gastrula zinc finger protein XlCGF8.2DB-like [Topomyia yanbarensis]
MMRQSSGTAHEPTISPNEYESSSFSTTCADIFQHQRTSVKIEAQEPKQIQSAEDHDFGNTTLMNNIDNASIGTDSQLPASDSQSEFRDQTDMPSKQRKRTVCEVCGKGFVEKRYMERHFAVHTGERPYKCEICDKGFFQKVSLQRHTIIHTGERPYKCDVCGKAFNRKSNLITHQRTHTGELPFKCDICGRAFNQKRYLDMHILTHIGERQHECELCGKQFVHKTNLQRHLITQHS